jgi:hypothetical protein
MRHRRFSYAWMIIILGLLSGGCGGAYWQWSKPGASTQQARQDGFECKQISRQSYLVGSGNTLMGGSEPDFNVWKECLEARGYAVTQQRDSDSTPKSAIGNYVASTQGKFCVAANSTIGSIVRAADGAPKKVTALYGFSPRCSVSSNPILADIEDGAAVERQASPLQLKDIADPVERLRKWREN